jgi:NTP pyrophosphatase (non-canonical NTP hydrolase)
MKLTEEQKSRRFSGENRVYAAVESGRISIDENGCVWRHHKNGLVTSAEKPMKNGYVMIRVFMDGKTECAMAHRLVWRHFHGRIFNNLTVNHKDGVKTNNCPSNLELATPYMQARHAIDKLKRYQPTGEECGRVTLTTDQVEEMRRRRLVGEKVAVLAKDYGVSKAQISRITRGVQWGHVEGNLTKTPSKFKERRKEMDFNYYQEQAAKTAVYPGSGTTTGLLYVTLGLASEAGEVAGAVKRIIRDDGGVLTEERRKQLISEVSDCIWYISQLCTELGVTFEEVAHRNLIKLNNRKERGTLMGSGDNR